MTEISNRLAAIRARSAAAAFAAGRGPDFVTLVAVSKTHPAGAVQAAIEAGQRVFGENKVQEAAGKFPPLRAAHPDLELHLIGPLQTNKAAQAAALFDVIQTLDRPKLAEVLAAEKARQTHFPRLFVQVNIGREPQKAGIAPEALAEFLEDCRGRLGLTIEGLMAIPPADAPPSPFFAQMRALAETHGLGKLSMGMSGDFEEAIALGATHVRVGTAIFGGR